VLAIEQVLARHASEWMSLPGVVGTGIGLSHGTRCIRVMVTESTPEVSQRIPPDIDGYRVEIVVTGRVRPRT